jgi:hypothetical protein
MVGKNIHLVYKLTSDYLLCRSKYLFTLFCMVHVQTVEWIENIVQWEWLPFWLNDAETTYLLSSRDYALWEESLWKSDKNSIGPEGLIWDNRESYHIPSAPYILRGEQRTMVMDIIRNLKMPSNYVGVIHKCLEEGKLRYMKSHNYHVLMHQVHSVNPKCLMFMHAPCLYLSCKSSRNGNGSICNFPAWNNRN